MNATELWHESLCCLQVDLNKGAPRQAVVQACLQTSLYITVAGLALRSAAYQIPDKLQIFDRSKALSLLTSRISSQQMFALQLYTAFIIN